MTRRLATILVVLFAVLPALAGSEKWEVVRNTDEFSGNSYVTVTRTVGSGVTAQIYCSAKFSGVEGMNPIMMLCTDFQPDWEFDMDLLGETQVGLDIAWRRVAMSGGVQVERWDALNDGRETWIPITRQRVSYSGLMDAVLAGDDVMVRITKALGKGSATVTIPAGDIPALLENESACTP